MRINSKITIPYIKNKAKNIYKNKKFTSKNIIIIQ